MKMTREMMWDCECGYIYSKEQEFCPICKSKKRKVSKHKNFTPIEVEEGDELTKNWEIKLYRTWLERFVDWFDRNFRGINKEKIKFEETIKV